MSTEITVRPVMDVTAHQDAIQAIQLVMRDVMKPGIHFGKVPGCGDKPVLLKPGAEKIMATFGIRPEVHEEQIPEPNGHVRYRVKVRALSHDGTFLGEGIGECSTSENKYAWESAVCEEQWEATPPSMRRIKYRQSGGHVHQDKQIQANPADKANTVLKMAKKRALVDVVLTVTAASDLFHQDLEEDAEEQGEAPAPIKPPQAKAKAQTKPVASGSTVTGIISRVASKSGETNGKAWTRYGVEMAGVFYNTFDEALADEAKKLCELQVQATITFKEGQRGKDLIAVAEAGPVIHDEAPDGGQIPF